MAAIFVILLIPVVSIAFLATAATQQRVNGLSGADRHLMLTGVAPEDGMVGGARSISPADVERVAALVPDESIAASTSLTRTP